jgi:hypothetical protein
VPVDMEADFEDVELAEDNVEEVSRSVTAILQASLNSWFVCFA